MNVKYVKKTIRKTVFYRYNIYTATHTYIYIYNKCMRVYICKHLELRNGLYKHACCFCFPSRVCLCACVCMYVWYCGVFSLSDTIGMWLLVSTSFKVQVYLVKIVLF